MDKDTIGFCTKDVPCYGSVVYEKEFPSELNLIPAVIYRLVDFLRNEGFIGEAQRNKLSLCFDEGLKNAVVHGNESAAERKVSLKVYACPDCFWVAISDEGRGFDLEGIPDPLEDSGLWRESGRGIHLMQHYSRAIEFWDRGSTLALCFPRESTGEPGAAGPRQEEETR
jgi:serine/threonine-protein kinase RsbW